MEKKFKTYRFAVIGITDISETSQEVALSLLVRRLKQINQQYDLSLEISSDEVEEVA